MKKDRSNAPRRMDWRRLLVEGGVIVFSILLAFLIDASWANRVERTRETQYLNLLKSDVESTLAMMDRFYPLSKESDYATSRLSWVRFQNEQPPVDSLVQWFALSRVHWGTTPQLGTAESLIQSGDLNLIQDVALRDLIPQYLSEMKQFVAYESNSVKDIETAYLEMGKIVDVWALRRRHLEKVGGPDHAIDLGMAPTEDATIPPLPEFSALFASQEVNGLISYINLKKITNSLWRERMKASTLVMASELDRVLEQ